MGKPSTANPGAMPGRDKFVRLTKSLAMLDAILCPDWQGRYYSFNSRWDNAEAMASMRNGCGDDWKAHITDAGIILFGLAHESDTYRPGEPWPGVLSDIPPLFSASVNEPAFDTGNVSYCLWLIKDSESWQVGNVELPFPDSADPDGSIEFLSILDGDPNTYKSWADYYYETDVDLSAVEEIYGGSVVTDELIRRLNPELSLPEIHDDIEQIGYQ